MAGKRNLAYRKRHQNRLGITLVSIVVLMILLVAGYKSRALKLQNEELKEQQAYYQQLIDEETARSSELQEYEDYTHTKKYAEEVAKEKLGFVKDGEILFIAE